MGNHFPSYSNQSEPTRSHKLITLVVGKSDDNRQVVHALGCVFAARFNISHHGILKQEGPSLQEFREIFLESFSEFAECSVARKLDETDFSKRLTTFAFSRSAENVDRQSNSVWFFWWNKNQKNLEMNCERVKLRFPKIEKEARSRRCVLPLLWFLNSATFIFELTSSNQTLEYTYTE